MSTNVLLDCHHARTGIWVGRGLKLILSSFNPSLRNIIESILKSRFGTKCENTVGSYECACIDGYEKRCFFENFIMNQFEKFLSIVELDDDTSTRRCIDVDECKQDVVTCNNFNEECVNTEGSFKCVCKVRQ